LARGDPAGDEARHPSFPVSDEGSEVPVGTAGGATRSECARRDAGQSLRVLLIGDVVGKPGRRLVREWVPRLRQERHIHLVVANAENAAGGNGLTHEVADELMAAGVDVLTSGNHIFDKREVLEFIQDVPQVLRPVNYPPGTPGRGVWVGTAADGTSVAVVNVAGRAFLPVAYDDPFRAMDAALAALPPVEAVLVDAHAETTSEKAALAWYLDGRITLLVGTHTHVQTADERILPGGTGFLTDLGMTGPYNSVIGVKTDLVLEKFLTQMPVRFETAGGPGQFCGLLVEVADGKTVALERVFIREP
jgi:metallophosphoesterase (TIGR00282 family)